jgi:hypothetical protein
VVHIVQVTDCSGTDQNAAFACILLPTSFPGLSYEDEARDEKALVCAGHVTIPKMAVFDSYSSRSGEIFFNEIYKSSKQINSQKIGRRMSIQKMLRKRIPLHPSCNYVIFT